MKIASLSSRQLYFTRAYAALSNPRSRRFDQDHEVAHIPEPIRHASGHRRGRAKSSVDLCEVVAEVIESHGGGVVFQLAAECIRQPGVAEATCEQIDSGALQS